MQVVRATFQRLAAIGRGALPVLSVYLDVGYALVLFGPGATRHSSRVPRIFIPLYGLWPCCFFAPTSPSFPGNVRERIVVYDRAMAAARRAS
jgi:hypothetical protein